MEWLNRLWNIYTRKDYAAVKKSVHYGKLIRMYDWKKRSENIRQVYHLWAENPNN